MFVAAETALDVGFAAARARLANLARGSYLSQASDDAYGEWTTGVARIGPLGSAPGLSRLVRVQFRGVTAQGDAAAWALRWEVTGVGGSLFPLLDADLTLTPDGEARTRLALAGAYRPPLGGVGAALDRAVLHRVATATVRSFVTSIGDAIAHPAGAPAGATPAVPLWLPPEPETP
jgi:hypothetical protein